MGVQEAGSHMGSRAGYNLSKEPLVTCCNQTRPIFSKFQILPKQYHQLGNHESHAKPLGIESLNVEGLHFPQL